MLLPLFIQTFSRSYYELPFSLCSVDRSYLMKSVDFGIAMGAGLGIKAGLGRIILDIRYILGLTDIKDIPKKSKELAESSEESIIEEKNMVLSFMLGYMFEF